MNTMITSKEEILKASRKLIRQKGWEAVNIRAVAAACGVSVGAIYYYFDSKAELTGAAVASIWQEIFHLPDDVPPPADTKTCILWICERIKEGNEKYPGFFTLHSLGFLGEEKADGKRRMHKTWHHILDILTFVIRQDPNIRPDTFTEQFTPEKFADVLFSWLLAALLRQDYDPYAILEVTQRTLYQ